MSLFIGPSSHFTTIQPRKVLSLPLIDSTIDIWITQRFPHIFVRKTPVSWSWAYITKIGNCDEYAAVFATLLRFAGFEARVVRASGEDHVWTEVKIDEEWTRVDASVPPSKPWYGNKSYYKEAWKFKISAVITEDGEVITENYTDTRILTVYVSDSEKPVKGVYVSVYSWNPVERKPDKYKAPLFVMEKRTNSTGIAVFMLGENNYTIKVFQDYFIFRILLNETNTTVIENANNELRMYFYTSVSRLDCFTLDGGLYSYLHFLDGKLVKSCAGITNFVHFKDSRSVFKSSSFLANSAN